eukprot:15413360-Alexandrium_andersonii.AAC.1
MHQPSFSPPLGPPSPRADGTGDPLRRHPVPERQGGGFRQLLHLRAGVDPQGPQRHDVVLQPRRPQ